MTTIATIVAGLIALPGYAVALNDRGDVALNTDSGPARWRAGRIVAELGSGGAQCMDESGNIGGQSAAGPAVWTISGESFSWPGSGVIVALSAERNEASMYLNGRGHRWRYRLDSPIALSELEVGGGAASGGFFGDAAVGSSAEFVNDNGRWYWYARPVWWDRFGAVHELEYQESTLGATAFRASPAGIVGSFNRSRSLGMGREVYWGSPVCWSSLSGEMELLPWHGFATGINSAGVMWGWQSSCETCNDHAAAMWYDGVLHFPTFDGTIPAGGPYVAEVRGINRQGWLLLSMSNGASMLYVPGPLPGDINGDGVVDNFDIDGFAAALIGDRTEPAADVNGDGLINNFDIEAFVAMIVSP